MSFKMGCFFFQVLSPVLALYTNPPSPFLPHPSVCIYVGICGIFADPKQPFPVGDVHKKKPINENEIHQSTEIDCTIFLSFSTMIEQKFGSRFDTQ